MFRSYLRYIENIEMISRRLTRTQKSEILEAYRAGGNTNELADQYKCTANTINRTVKTLLTDSEYKLLKKKRSKTTNKNDKKEDLEHSNSFISSNEIVDKGDISIKEYDESPNTEFEEIPPLAIDDSDDFSEDLSSETQNNQNFDNNFEEITPLFSGFEFDQEKQKSDFEILNYESLPESVYMIVDKKVELELQPISDLPEWSFLPENELQRNAILLFSNQRTAKRICSRNQRVIKVPNTSIFKLSKSYLISKGITRLILEDSIIGLDD